VFMRTYYCCITRQLKDSGTGGNWARVGRRLCSRRLRKKTAYG